MTTKLLHCGEYRGARYPAQAIAQSPNPRRVGCSCNSSATLLLERRTSSANGLRKAGATITANNGATHLLVAIFGWDTIEEAEKYTAKADHGDWQKMLCTCSKSPGKSGREFTARV